MSHVLGFVGVDNQGLAGVERFYEDTLRHTARKEPLRLTLDMRLQDLMRSELMAAVKEFRAIGATGIITHIKTGEVMSLVNLPDFDPNDPGASDPEALFNRAALGTYEMGSTFKTFTVAQALDNGIVGMRDGYDTTKPIRVASYTISDYHPKSRWLSVPEIFAYSSNIGTVRMAMELGIKRQKSYMDKLGMLRPISLELPEKAMPLYPSKWRKINMMTISYGHGISVTPLHLVQAFGGILNDGQMHALTLQKEKRTTQPTRVLSKETSHKIRRLLRSVVQYGTGKNGDAPGYRVGGKTGTAEKVSGRGYSDKAKLASFMSAFPMDDPEYAILVMLDEPKGNRSTYGYATGGWVAAPVVSRVVSQMGPLLGIEPVMEMAPDSMDAMWETYIKRERERRRAVHAASY